MFVKGHPPYNGPGRPKGCQNKHTIEAKALPRGLLNDKTYRRNLQKRLRTGEAGAMEPMLWAYAFGKPKEQLEMNWHLERLTDQELAQMRTLAKRVS